MAIAGMVGVCTSALARDGMFIINLPWAKPAADGRSATVYMDLTSTTNATLVDVNSDVAASVALMGPPTVNAATTKAATTKTASAIARLALRANERLALAPGGYGIALRKLLQPMRIGDRVALTLTIEYPDGSRQDVPVTAEARMRSPLDDERRGHHAH